MNTASRDKFPRAILPRSFDFGFATGLMVKDVRLALDEMKSLGLSMEVAEAVGRLWEVVIRETGADSDFTSAIKPIEKAAGVVVGGPRADLRGSDVACLSPCGRGCSIEARRMSDACDSQTPHPVSHPFTTRSRKGRGSITTTAPACPSRSGPRPRRAGAPPRIGRP